MEYDGIAIPGTGGWAEVLLSDRDRPPPRVLVKFGTDSLTGRDMITCVILVGAGYDPSADRPIPIDSSTLRAIPIGRVEALLNSTPVPSVARGEGEPGPFAEEISAMETALGAYLRAAIPDHLPKPFAARTRQRRKPLTRPTGADQESFYRLVAEAYSEAIRTTRAPAPVLAEEAGVPVTTVHRWIREARQRGFLPPARRGRAG